MEDCLIKCCDYKELAAEIEDGSVGLKKNRIMSEIKHKEDIKEYEELSEKDYIAKFYVVTNNGIVYRTDNGKEVKSVVTHKGYKQVRLHSPMFSKSKDKRKGYRVHRLVAMFYLDNYSDELQVNHKNGIKTDNRVENLEMVTNAENAYHAWNVLDSADRRKKVSEKNKNKGRKVYQYTKDGNYVSQYKNSKVAGDKNGLKGNTIWHSCVGFYLYGGYYWRFNKVQKLDVSNKKNKRLLKYEYNGKTYSLIDLSMILGIERHRLREDILNGKISCVKANCVDSIVNKHE